jgi:uncharacterized GH25 family protein
MRASRTLACVAAATSIVATASVASGHDTWLRSESGTAMLGARVTFHLTSGDGFAADDFAIESARLRGAWVRLGGKRTPLQVVPGGAQPNGAGALLLRALCPTAGIATAWVTLAPKRLDLDSAKQVEYLDDIHATDAVRARWRRMGVARWREVYTKHAKAMVRVAGGVASTRDSSWGTPVGLGLEIIPDRDPTTLAVGDQLGVRVLRGGKPFAGLPLGALHDGDREGEWKVTDAAGRATFAIGKGGAWLLHGTDLRPSARPDVDWESDFTTLTLHVVTPD